MNEYFTTVGISISPFLIIRYIVPLLWRLTKGSYMKCLMVSSIDWCKGKIKWSDQETSR